MQSSYVVYERTADLPVKDMVNVLGIGRSENAAKNNAREMHQDKIAADTIIKNEDDEGPGIFIQPCLRSLHSHCEEYGYCILVERVDGGLRAKKTIDLKTFCDSIKGLYEYLGWFLSVAKSNGYENSEQVNSATASNLIDMTLNNFGELQEKKIV